MATHALGATGPIRVNVRVLVVGMALSSALRIAKMETTLVGTVALSGALKRSGILSKTLPILIRLPPLWQLRNAETPKEWEARSATTGRIKRPPRQAVPLAAREPFLGTSARLET